MKIIHIKVNSCTVIAKADNPLDEMTATEDQVLDEIEKHGIKVCLCINVPNLPEEESDEDERFKDQTGPSQVQQPDFLVGSK